MENSLESAKAWYTEVWQRSVVLPGINNTENMAVLFFEYGQQILAPKDQQIVRQEKEIASLKAQLSRAKASSRLGINPDRL